MNGHESLAARFEAHRDHLRGVAYRMLGSLDDADDAVQAAWLRVDRAGVDGVENLAGWLTTVVARVCLDVLRIRRTRGEESLTSIPEAVLERPGGIEPEQEAVLAESVGRALLVVLDRLTPAERVAFVLHDLFAVPFAEIAPVVGRSSVASKKLASRARDRVRGVAAVDEADLAEHYGVVDAFLAAARGGDLDTLVRVLAPDVVRQADRFAVPDGAARDVRGARAVAEETPVFAHRARMGEVALVDGRPGIVIAPSGRLFAVLRLTVETGRITRIEVIADPTHLAELPLAAGRP
ncbi:sigma-70 family RNA polymerase sigma factor [Embleya scabrispora]|uniref:sigma-70 family RNA polymerase sigma factor n=1 Tax=Embleya scabrispora TaxID=159449 RepID=UPI0004780134|nr:sigma-70 family RNA polymerase sigma factor [Embleya scabrispora]MYS82736.1 sigma-70 family RNA polymerase sigma factor [Streptomyces sp. SID5474]